MTQFIDWALYRQILETMPIPCVDIAVVANGAVLLVMREDAPAKGEWWLPGGRILKGEMMKDTAMRKAQQEVGIACNVGPIIHTAETIFPDGPDGIPIHSINSCFFMFPADPTFEVTLDAHSREYRWVDHIPPGVHSYVERCLMGAGLEKRRDNP